MGAAQCEVVIRKEAVIKCGMRKPSWKKSLSARTKGRATRAVKRALIPGYGKKGMGWLHPKRKLYTCVPIQMCGSQTPVRFGDTGG